MISERLHYSYPITWKRTLPLPNYLKTNEIKTIEPTIKVLSQSWFFDFSLSFLFVNTKKGEAGYVCVCVVPLFTERSSHGRPSYTLQNTPTLDPVCTHSILFTISFFFFYSLTSFSLVLSLSFNSFFPCHLVAVNVILNIRS